MRVLFPARPSTREVDSSFADELAAAKAHGFETSLYDIELHLGGDVVLRNMAPGPILHRGWICKDADYARLAQAVTEREGDLRPTIEQYRYCCDFPSWYRDLEGYTPKSVWVPQDQMDSTLSARLPSLLAEGFGEGGVIVKDYIKSQKHNWFDACYIPDVRDADNVRRVVAKFLDLQEGFFVGGLVFRRFVPLKRVGTHPKSKMPLVNEWRAFLWNRELMYLAPYWAEGADYGAVPSPDPGFIRALGEKISTGFMAIDVAELEGGAWTAVEINDGGSAGIPEGGTQAGLGPEAFYEALKACSA